MGKRQDGSKIYDYAHRLVCSAFNDNVTKTQETAVAGPNDHYRMQIEGSASDMQPAQHRQPAQKRG